MTRKRTKPISTTPAPQRGSGVPRADWSLLAALSSVSFGLPGKFHEPSLCCFSTRKSLRRILTALSFGDILNVVS